MPSAPNPTRGTGIAGAMDYVPAASTAGYQPLCFVCGGPWKKSRDGRASYASRAGACFPGYGKPLAEVCSAECAGDQRWS